MSSETDQKWLKLYILSCQIYIHTQIYFCTNNRPTFGRTGDKHWRYFSVSLTSQLLLFAFVAQNRWLACITCPIAWTSKPWCEVSWHFSCLPASLWGGRGGSQAAEDERRLLFTIGQSATGLNNVITWNDIHHKTDMGGGPQLYAPSSYYCNSYSTANYLTNTWYWSTRYWSVW